MATAPGPAAFLSTIANVSVSDEVIYIVTLFVSLGFSLVLRRLETKFARKLFSLCFGVTYCALALGYNLTHSLLTVLVRIDFYIQMFFFNRFDNS